MPRICHRVFLQVLAKFFFLFQIGDEVQRNMFFGLVLKLSDYENHIKGAITSAKTILQLW